MLCLTEKCLHYVAAMFLCAEIKAWISTDFVAEHPAYPRMCLDKKHSIVFMDGVDRYDLTRCTKQTCRAGYGLSHTAIVTTGCSSVHAKPPCQLVPGDTSAVFPGCCRKIRCPPRPSNDARLYLQYRQFKTKIKTRAKKL
ncbi:unnamed protein product [Timema podura]|uniref:Single domain-containing protein n=1 Tax=Timema podura TaxID=61482 RepID=A0ABN7NKT2_TIMPD|nr:unnamed protein product [Timema podura]